MLAHLLLFFDNLNISNISSVLWHLTWLREGCERLLLLAWQWGLLEVSCSPASFRLADRLIVAASILVLLALLRLALALLLLIDLRDLLFHKVCLLVAYVLVL